jgi:dTDP-4-dehydrorhamnose reductase
MPSILLLGKNGMLGQAIDRQFKVQSSKFKVISWGREELDITNKKDIQEKVVALSPSVVVNAIGYTNVDGAETEQEIAFKVNAVGVGYLADVCSQIGAGLIHFSTDYVFDGSQPQGYLEDDIEHLGPVNVYGESKLEGESRISSFKFQVSSLKHYIIRTSWLYGAGGKNFVDTLITRARDCQKEFKVVDDQFGKPTWTVDLARRVVWLVERLDEFSSGVYHCTNETKSAKCKVQSAKLQLKAQSGRKTEGVSWYEFACEIFRQAKELGILSETPQVIPCTTAEFPRPARRPHYSALLNTKLPVMRDWQEALREYIEEIGKPASPADCR